MRTIRSASLLALGILIAGCGRNEDAAPAESQETPAETTAATEPDPKKDLIEACHLKITEPEVREWTTYWDPRGKRALGEGDSWVHSFYWGNEEERKQMLEMKNPMLEFACSAKDANRNMEIGVGASTMYMSQAEFPFAPGTYEIVAGGSEKYGNEPKAIYGNFMYGDSTLWKTAGTLTITRFDDKGIAGSFSLVAEDRLQPRTLKIEGTFDMPCRGGMVEGGCRANKAIRDE